MADPKSAGRKYGGRTDRGTQMHFQSGMLHCHPQRSGEKIRCRATTLTKDSVSKVQNLSQLKDIQADKAKRYTHRSTADAPMPSTNTQPEASSPSLSL